MEFKQSAACKKLIDIHDPQKLMIPDSKGSHYDVPVDMTGFAVVEPIKESTKQLGVSDVRSASSYELTSQASQQDKRTGGCDSATARLVDRILKGTDKYTTRAGFRKWLAQEFKDSRGEEFGYVYKMMEGCDKQGFPMKKGALTPDDVRILFDLSKDDDIRKYVKAPKIKRRHLRH